MKVLATGVAGQLGHDVMNELVKRNYEGTGSDIAPAYSGVWPMEQQLLRCHIFRWTLRIKFL